MTQPPQTKVSPMEKCSFVCHLLAFPIGFAYILWVLVPDERLESWDVAYFPPKEWSVHMPVSALLLFLATPILYAAMNALTVPRLDSMDTIRDDYTRTPTSNHVLSKTVQAESTLPEICDLDPATLVWYPRVSKEGK